MRLVEHRHARMNDVASDRVRRAGRRRRTVGRGGRVLARDAGHARARGREEALPAREDVRRRAHAARRPPAPRHGPRRPARGASSASTVCARSPTASPSSSPGPSTPISRRTDTSCAGASSTRWWPSARSRRAPRCGRAPRRSRRWSRTACVARRGRARTRTTGRPSRSAPATSSSPTAPTRASAGRSAPPATGRIPWAWRFAATSRARTTTSRGSRAISTSRDRDGNHLPGYGWIFPVGDGTVNVGVGLLSTFSGWKNVNTIAPDGGVLRDRAGALGHLARDRVRRRRPAGGSRPADR